MYHQFLFLHFHREFLHCNNDIAILTIPFVIWVARYGYRHGFIQWYCIWIPWDQSI